MSFYEFISSYPTGLRGLAQQLKCTRMTVRGWLKCGASPNARYMKKVVEISKGKVSYEDIVNDTIRLTAKLKKQKNA